MDMSTIAVPPALPTCMSVGVAFAIARLKNK
jgi:magnesium-transporting ATPase (P-type)